MALWESKDRKAWLCLTCFLSACCVDAAEWAASDLVGLGIPHIDVVFGSSNSYKKCVMPPHPSDCNDQSIDLGPSGKFFSETFHIYQLSDGRVCAERTDTWEPWDIYLSLKCLPAGMIPHCEYGVRRLQQGGSKSPCALQAAPAKFHKEWPEMPAVTHPPQPGPPPTDCSVPHEYAPEHVQHWCCTHQPKSAACSFDCQGGLAGSQSFSLQSTIAGWCCQHQQIGCDIAAKLPATTPTTTTLAPIIVTTPAWIPGIVATPAPTTPAPTTPAPIENIVTKPPPITTVLPKQPTVPAHGHCGDVCTCPGMPKAPQCTVPPAVCRIWGDPHIRPFDNPAGVNNFFDEGEYWIVKTPYIWIQGRFMATEWTHGLSAMQKIAVGGPFIGNRVITVGPKWTGHIMTDKGPILQTFPSSLDTNCPCVKLRYDNEGDLVDPRQAKIEPVHIVHMELPLGVHIEVFRWAKHIDARITMPGFEGGHEGTCGNFNGDPADDSADQIKARNGYRVHHDHMLFKHHADAKMAPKLHVSDCKPHKLGHAKRVCREAHPEASSALLDSCVIDVCFGGNEYYLEDGKRHVIKTIMKKQEVLTHEVADGWPLVPEQATRLHVNVFAFAGIALTLAAGISLRTFGRPSLFDRIPVWNARIYNILDPEEPQDIDELLASYG